MAFPANFLTLQDSVIDKLRMNPTSDRTRIKDWVNQLYAEIAVECEAVQVSNTMLLTANTASYNMPSQVVRIKEMSLTPSGQTQYRRPLVPVSIEQILEWRSGSPTATGTGSPTHYAHLGYQQLEVWPTPQAADTINIWYVGLPTALSANGDVPVIQEPYASKLLEYGALAEAADFLHHPDKLEYRQVYEDWKRRFRSHINTRKKGAGTMQLRVIGEGGYPAHDPSTDNRGW